MAITKGEMPDGMRKHSSWEINEAIEVLRHVGAPRDTLTALDAWNAARLVDAAQQASTNEELRQLFAGLRPSIRARVGVDS